jgi:hypothetical protein
MKTYCWQMYLRPYNDVKALLPHPFFSGFSFLPSSRCSCYLIGLKETYERRETEFHLPYTFLYIFAAPAEHEKSMVLKLTHEWEENFASLIAWQRIKVRSRFAHKVSHYL